ncbi:hypothetical protein SBADM41S_10343 [Streptomyces badius]
MTRPAASASTAFRQTSIAAGSPDSTAFAQSAASAPGSPDAAAQPGHRGAEAASRPRGRRRPVRHVDGDPALMAVGAGHGHRGRHGAAPGADGPNKRSVGVADGDDGACQESGHRKEIGTFLDYAYSDENVLEFAEQYDLLPVTGSASAAMETDKKHQKLHEFLVALPNSTLPPFGKTSWATVSDAIKKKIGNAVAPGSNPESILGEISAEAAQAEAAE